MKSDLRQCIYGFYVFFKNKSIFLLNASNKIILLLQYSPNQLGSHCKQDPFSMWHVLSLQLIGHGISQLLPYTPCFTQPNRKDTNKVSFNDT